MKQHLVLALVEFGTLKGSRAPLKGSRAGWATLLAAALLAGCLPGDPPVKGTLLYRGSNIERPVFLKLADEPWVMFQTRVQRPTRSQGGTTDVHLVKWTDGSGHRVVVQGRADRSEWPAVDDASGARFYMTDERLAPNGLPVGTLNRISLTEGLKETVPDVMSYALSGSRKTFYYRKYVAGAAQPELHLRDLNGRDRNLGLLSGQVVLLGDDLFYFIAGPGQTLTRVAGFDGEAVVLRTRVTRFQLGAGERFALATVSDEGVLRSIVLDFVGKTERKLPVDNPCCWLGLSGNQFTFAESARPGKTAELHYFDVTTGIDRVVKMPPGLADVVSIVGRPGPAGEALIFDSQRNVAIYRPNVDPAAPAATAPPQVEVTGLRPWGPSFSPDGKYLIYLIPDPPPPPPAVSNVLTGQLFAQDMDSWALPPRRLSPEGASVPVEPRGYLIRDGKPYPLVFWARFGLGASDLYLGDHETGESLKVAEGIGEVSVSHSHVLGVLNMSQDLTGDLVFRDFASGKEIVVEHGVHEVEFDGELFEGDYIVFTVHERNPASHRNGLWATTLPPIENPPVAPRLVIAAPGLSDTAGRGGGGDAPKPSSPARYR